MIEIGPNLAETLQVAAAACMAIAVYWFIFRS